MFKGVSNLETALAHLHRPDRGLVLSAAFLHDRNGLVNATARFEVTQENDGVGEVADVDRALHRADEAVLREHEDRGHRILPEVAQQLVQMKEEKLLLRNGVEVAVETVDD